MLLTKEVEIGLSGRHIKWYKNKGYIIPREKDNQGRLSVPQNTKILVKVEDLLDSYKVQVDIGCDECGEYLKTIALNDYRKYIKDDEQHYCINCFNSLYINGIKAQEVKQIINNNLGDTWKLLNVKIINTQINVDLINSDGYMYSKIKISSIKKGYIPQGFYKSNIYIYQNINNWCKINNYNIRLSDEYIGYDVKLKWECLDCNHIFERSMNAITRGQVGCSICGDNISYPNKFGRNLLNQLNNTYKLKYIKFEYSPDWIKPKRYDSYFEFNNKKYIIEMDRALGHGNKKTLDGTTPEESQAIDDYKDKKAKEHNIKMIRIDCVKSDMKYIRDNILVSGLAQIFDLSNIDWLKCHEFACNNLVKETSKLWNAGIKNSSEISVILNLGKRTVIRYLNECSKLGWCDYDANEIQKASGVRLGKSGAKPVVQLSLSGEYVQEYSSMVEAEKQTGIIIMSISSCCRGKLKSAGGYQWMFLSDYNKSEIKQYKKSPYVKKVVQLSLNKEYISEFDSIIEAERQLKINHSNISSCCLCKYNHAGGFKWMYKSDYEKLVR